MSSRDLIIGVEDCGDIKIISVNGPVDVANNEIFNTQVGAVCRGQNNKVVLDLSGLSYINSRGMGLMIEFSRQAANGQGKFVVCSPNEPVRKNIELLHLDAVVDIKPTLEEALASLK